MILLNIFGYVKLRFGLLSSNNFDDFVCLSLTRMECLSFYFDENVIVVVVFASASSLIFHFLSLSRFFSAKH